MAMTAFEIFGVLKLDKKDFESGMKDAEHEASGLKSKLSGIGGVMGGATSVIGGAASTIARGMGVIAKVSGAALGAATTAATGFAKASMDAAISYESAFTGVRKTVDATEEEYSALSDWIMDASTRMALSKEDIAATMEIAGQLGVEGVEGLEKFTETMIMLGDTTNLNAEEAASALAKFGNIAGLQPEDMDKIGSAIVDLGNHFATTEADITEMSTRLASAGTIAGLSATDILGLATAMSSVGIQAEAGGTAMAQTMASMTKAVEGAIPYLSQPYETLDDDAKEAMDSLYQYADVSGMTAQQFAEAWKGEPITAIQAFIGGLGEMNEADESVVMMLDEMGLKGIRQSNMLQALALASDTMTSAVNTANTAFEENVALQNEANTRYATTESQALQAAEAFKNLQVAIGDELQPTYAEFLSFSQVAMKDISEGLKSGGFEGMMSAMGTALSDGLNMIVELIPKAISMGGDLLSALGQGISDNLPEIAKAATSVVVELTKGILGSAEGIATGAATFIESFVQAFEENGAVLVEEGQKLLDLLVSGMVNNSFSLGEFVINAVNNLVGFFAEHAQDMVTVAVTIITQLVDGLIAGIPDLIRGAADLIVGLVLGLTDPANLMQILIVGTNLIVALVDGLIEAIPRLLDALPQVISNLVAFLIAAGPQLLMVGIQLLLALINGLIRTIPRLVAAIPAIILALVGGLKRGVQQIVEVGRQMVEGLWRGIKGRWDRLVEDVKALGSKLVGGLKDLLGIKSPSRVFAEIGRQLDAGLAKGITDNVGLVDKAMRGLDFDLDSQISPTISLPVVNSTPLNNKEVSSNSEIIELLKEIAENRNVTVVLEQDADAMFRVMQRKSRINKQITGQNAFE